MGKIVHVRLDEESLSALEELVAKLGSTESAVIRQALHFLVNSKMKGVKRKIFGLGKFKSSITDLGSNKKHLTGFGK
jgi:Ribbon-helix-helix protein, copG family